MKRVITKTLPTVLTQGAILYDAMLDVIAADSYDTTDALYVAQDVPVPAVLDAQGKVITPASPVTELVPPDPSILARHTFAGWPIVGKPL